jgi:PAS domain S-box-containing protein
MLAQRFIFRYLLAIFVVVLTFALRIWLIPLTGVGAPFVLFFAAVLVTTLFAGVGPGIWAVLLSIGLAAYTFVVGAGYPVFQAVFQSLFFAVDGSVVVYLMFLMKKGRHAIEDSNLQLRESEERFRLTIDEAPIGIALVSLDTRFVRVNRVLCEILGYTASELTTLKVRDITHPDDIDERDVLAGRRLARGEITRYQVEKRHIRKDGSVGDIMVSGSMLHGNDGAPLFYICHFEDITARKRLENGQRFLAEAGAVLASSLDYEETLGNVAQLAVRDLADFCIVGIIEENGIIRPLKVSSRDPSKAWVCDLFMQVPIREPRSSLIAPVLENRQTVFIPFLSPETVSSLPDEGRKALRAGDVNSFIAVPLLAHGKLLGLIVFLSSAGFRKYEQSDVRLAEELARRAALSIENARLFGEAQRAIKTREDVLAVVSHDLKNPLSNIQLVVRLFRDMDGIDTEQVRKFVDTVQRASDEMRALITDLLDFARIENGTFSVVLSADRLSSVVFPVIDRIRVLAEAKQQKIDLDLPSSLPEIAVDAHRLRQVISNLLSNAIKFTPSQGVIRVTARQRDNEILVSVSDTGPGIPQEHLSKIFDRFWRAPGTKPSGSGLGLAIAKGIVLAHGGTIWAASEFGKGSSFFFTIPLATLDTSNPTKRAA